MTVKGEDSSLDLHANEPPGKRKRLEALAEDAQYIWDLPASMADYANEYLIFEEFCPREG